MEYLLGLGFAYVVAKRFRSKKNLPKNIGVDYAIREDDVKERKRFNPIDTPYDGKKVTFVDHEFANGPDPELRHREFDQFNFQDHLKQIPKINSRGYEVFY